MEEETEGMMRGQGQLWGCTEDVQIGREQWEGSDFLYKYPRDG